MYSASCVVKADTSQIARLPTAMRFINRRRYYEIDYFVVLQFGLTELKAQIAWMQDVRVLLIPSIFLILTL